MRAYITHERMLKAMRGYVVALALALAVCGAATGDTNTFFFPSQVEVSWTRSDVPRRFHFVQLGNVRYGPVRAAACRGEGARLSIPKRGFAYRQFVCALRVGNADRLLVIRDIVNRNSFTLGNGDLVQFIRWQ